MTDLWLPRSVAFSYSLALQGKPIAFAGIYSFTGEQWVKLRFPVPFATEHEHFNFLQEGILDLYLSVCSITIIS